MNDYILHNICIMRMLNHALDIFTLTSIGNAIHEHVLTTTIAEPKASVGDAIIQNCPSCCLRAIGKCEIQLRIRNPLKWNDYISIWAFFAPMTKISITNSPSLSKKYCLRMIPTPHGDFNGLIFFFSFLLKRFLNNVLANKNGDHHA